MLAKGQWVCCQLGAREHYAIPRSLHRKRNLRLLVTDAWQLRDRFEPDLGDANVVAFNHSVRFFEFLARARDITGWRRIVARNEWFQKKAIGRIVSELASNGSGQAIVFSYSYAALEILRFAKSRGCKTVLGQIDGGMKDNQMVQQLYDSYSRHTAIQAPPPDGYWSSWLEECQIADVIAVNSNWSKKLLISAGVGLDKLHVIPLAYETSSIPDCCRRKYPTMFSSDRPLRVLFLGRASIRKGIAEVLSAARELADEAVQFTIVGDREPGLPLDDQSHNIRWVGPVPRGDVGRWYGQADVFLFPTHSDGFGLTQLEAQAWQLPVIASRFCGEVVTDGVNGLLLPEVTPAAIVDAIRTLLEDPARLESLAARSKVDEKFRLASIGRQLMEVAA